MSMRGETISCSCLRDVSPARNESIRNNFESSWRVFSDEGDIFAQPLLPFEETPVLRATQNRVSRTELRSCSSYYAHETEALKRATFTTRYLCLRCDTALQALVPWWKFLTNSLLRQTSKDADVARSTVQARCRPNWRCWAHRSFSDSDRSNSQLSETARRWHFVYAITMLS